MPKKFRGENTKAVSAKERKAAKSAEERDQREKAAEDAKWRDDDKNVNKKNQRKEDREKKRLEENQRKQENRKLAEEEDAALASSATTVPAKMTRYQLQQQQRQQQVMQQKQAASDVRSESLNPSQLLVENTNRAAEETVSATGLENAIKALSVDGSKAAAESGRVNMAAAYRQFELANMSTVKKDYPTFSYSQRQQLIKKQWQKSPENPLNQPSS